MSTSFVYPHVKSKIELPDWGGSHEDSHFIPLLCCPSVPSAGRSTWPYYLVYSQLALEMVTWQPQSHHFELPAPNTWTGGMSPQELDQESQDILCRKEDLDKAIWKSLDALEFPVLLCLSTENAVHVGYNGFSWFLGQRDGPWLHVGHQNRYLNPENMEFNGPNSESGGLFHIVFGVWTECHLKKSWSCFFVGSALVPLWGDPFLPECPVIGLNKSAQTLTGWAAVGALAALDLRYSWGWGPFPLNTSRL
jgi:hypothetical protein